MAIKGTSKVSLEDQMNRSSGVQPNTNAVNKSDIDKTDPQNPQLPKPPKAPRKKASAKPKFPWSGKTQSAKPELSRSVNLNEYELEVINFIRIQTHVSIRSFLHDHLQPIIKQMAVCVEAGQPVGMLLKPEDLAKAYAAVQEAKKKKPAAKK